MQFQVISDIHLEEKLDIPIIVPRSDTLFLAGDIGVIGHPLYEAFMRYCSYSWETVFYVVGNHELYSNTKPIDELVGEYKDFLEKFNNIVLLDHSKCQHGGYQIIGCTFWGDFSGDNHISGSPKKIHIRENGKLIPIGGNRLCKMNAMSQNWVIDNIHPVLPTIILTHFPLTLQNDKVRQVKYRDEDQNVLMEYGTDMRLMSMNGLICISGHTHYSHDFIKNGVRYISNQLGYRDEQEDNLCEYTFGTYSVG